MWAAAADEPALRRLHAFGTDYETDLALAGVHGGWAGGARCRLVEADGPAPPLGVRIGGPAALAVYDRGAAGFLIHAPGVGRCELAPDGSRVAWSAEGRREDLERLVIGQAMPFVAALQGREVLHAAAVVRGGRALGLLGASGAGKTSVALALVERGADLLTDDVLAIEPRDGVPTVHPGTGTVNVREADDRRLGRPGARRAVGGRAAAVPLDALYVLERDAPVASVEVARELPADPRLLLAAGFNLCVRTRERLVRHLDACALLATQVRLYRVAVPAGATAGDVAAAIAA